MGKVWRWHEVEFLYAATLAPEVSAGGELMLHFPQERYLKKGSVGLHRYGVGPFCRFRVKGLPHAAGVYVYLVEDNPVYVGEAIDLSSRFYAYGNISPKNCYKGGRETNCRMNTRIFQTYLSGGTIDVYIHETASYKTLEAQMIEELQPAWNRRGIR